MWKIVLRELNKGFLLMLVFPVLAGCVPFWKTPQTRPVSGPMPYHENWCYETLGHADCYPGPQNVDPDRLINVDPPSRYPMTPEDYRKALAESPGEAPAKGQ